MSSDLRKQNIDGLDLLKAIAATIIVFHHYQQVFDVLFPWINFYNGTIYFGYFVELFFLISGFVSVYTLKDDNNVFGISNVAKNLAHKLSRIFPIVTIALIFEIIIKTIDYSLFATGDLSSIYNVKTLFANFLLLFRGWGVFDMMGINNPTWYLCILIQCYIVFYVIIYIQKQRLRRDILFVYIFNFNNPS